MGRRASLAGSFNEEENSGERGYRGWKRVKTKEEVKIEVLLRVVVFNFEIVNWLVQFE